MDYLELTKHIYEKIICLSKLKIINLDNKLYELYNRWLGAYDCKSKIRLNVLTREINIRELQLYQKANNVRLE